MDAQVVKQICDLEVGGWGRGNCTRPRLDKRWIKNMLILPLAHNIQLFAPEVEVLYQFNSRNSFY